ncbi:Acyl-CoA dehydrogenase, C-terminal domain [Actinokineospora alba]|uniref:Acyl-CoA dehydrogenase, C-terminal domain n=1 Tax=Actinokineospora alba TaxID=504798 RepID=A0A1H0HG36_9PSEU|nr:acyl-CoA dehydrogenase family protein [Actinokineospora alba]TDP64897.1 acyl-CoA dehydrogenase-like protein [Actinokineospora alba]SDH48689.1 Acyl-CoA dehydrogenase, C-terminal domain [Actinokineospora alba]SDO18155.1 Acyl-CoA dehydrogenase, C-terminal domain [Actinokineospora alba]
MSVCEADLEAAFGADVGDVLAADEQRVPWGAEVLAGLGVSAACVPADLGGGWKDTAELIGSLRAVCRRDLTAGLSLVLGAVRPVLLPAASAEVAAQVLSGRLVAFADDDVSPRTGTVVTHGRDAELLVGTRARRTVLVDGRELDELRRDLRPVALSGCRALDVAVTSTPIPGASKESGADPDDWAYLVSSVVGAGAAVGALDTCLRLVLDFASERRLYGVGLLDLPHARGLIAGAAVDLRVADALSRAAAAAVDARADEQVVAGAAFVLPRLLSAAVRDLATVLGARFYLRGGPHAWFGKAVRDLAVLRVLCGDGTRCAPVADSPANLAALADQPWSHVVRDRVDRVEDEGRPPLPEPVADTVLPEVLSAHRDRVSFDSNQTPLGAQR